MTFVKFRPRRRRRRRRPQSSTLQSMVAVAAAAVSSGAPLDDGPPMTWTPLDGYPGPGRHHPITFANETHAFLLTGSTRFSPAASDLYMYEETSGTWTDLTATDSAPPVDFAGRSFGYGVVLDREGHPHAYLGMGADATGSFLADLWEFDMTTHRWRRLSDMPGPGRRHPAMNAVRNSATGGWEIHVGLGDGIDPASGGRSNFDDWWVYDVESEKWGEAGRKFPSTRRHHPFHFSLGGISYAGLGHSNSGIERDFYSYDAAAGGLWTWEGEFASYNFTPAATGAPMTPATTEARVAGTQFSVELSPRGCGGDALDRCPAGLGFVLSGDGDDHGSMDTGEFHAFYPAGGDPPSNGDVVYSSSPRWQQLPPHPGRSRWAPGSFVMRGTARAYFTSGYDRVDGVLYADLWQIDLAPLFEAQEGGSETTATTTVTTTSSPRPPGEAEASTTTAATSAPRPPGETETSATTTVRPVAPTLPSSSDLVTSPVPQTESDSPAAIRSPLALSGLAVALCARLLAEVI